MALDLHGLEVTRVDSPAPPIAVGASAVIGLVGSAPDAAGARAALAIPGGGGASLVLTAAAVGESGNGITMTVIGGAGALAAAAVGTDITVTLASGGSTITQVVAAMAAVADIAALVTPSVGAAGNAAAAAQTPLAGGVGPAVAENTPTLLNTASLIARLGTAGALPAAVRDVLRTAPFGGATIIAVRTADDAENTLAGTPAVRSGVYALLNAEALTGRQPRLIAAPGARGASITTALQAVAAGLRAVAVVTVEAATAGAAIAANPDLPRVLACWPELVVVDGGAEVVRPADALALGHIARNDKEHSFASSPSNRLLQGVLRPARPVSWEIDSRTSDANALNQGDLVTFVRRGSGVWFWGNRLSGGALIHRQRADDIIGAEITGALLDYVDRKVDLPFVEHVLGRLGAYLRNLVINGHIRTGRAWFDPQYNTSDTLGAGQVTFSFEFTPHDIAEHVVIRSSLTEVPNEILAGLLP